MSLQNSAIEKRRIGSSEKGEDVHGSRELKSKFNGSRESSSSSSFYCLYKKMCDVHLFQARPPSRNSKKYRADDLCVNLVCEYFCWMLGDPPFFLRITSFSDSFHYTKKQKKICTWEVLIAFDEVEREPYFVA